jgi:hypothetical protein
METISKCGICKKKFIKSHHLQKYCSKRCIVKRRRIYEQSPSRKIVNYKAQSKYFRTKKGKKSLMKGIRKYRQTPRGKYTVALSRIKHREAKNNIISLYSKNQWIDKVKDVHGICPQCGKRFRAPGRALSIEHGYPVSFANRDFIRTGIRRTYTIDDVEPLCMSCNVKNYHKFKDEMFFQQIMDRATAVARDR